MWLVTKWALRSRVVTILLALIVSGVSVWGFLGLKTELIPDINFPYTFKVIKEKNFLSKIVSKLPHDNEMIMVSKKIHDYLENKIKISA